MLHRDVVGHATDQLEGRDPAANTLAGEREQRQRLPGALEPDEGGRLRPRIGEEPQGHGSDDSERAFRADEQALDVIAGIVLAQLAQRVDDPPVGEDRFDARDEVARVAIGDDRQAAGVGRDVAADGGGPLRRERQRKQTIGRQRGGLRLGERHACFADHHVGVRINLADRLQPLGRQDDLVACLVRRLAADEPGIAALRHDSDPRLVAEGHDGRDFRGRPGANEGERLSLVEAARLDQRPGDQIRVGERIACADDGLERPKRGVAT